MATESVKQPFRLYHDKEGNPLDGLVYIGTSGVDPTKNKISIFWDSAKTIEAENPFETLNGYPLNSGAIGSIYFDPPDYSIGVYSKRNTLEYQSLNESITSFALKDFYSSSYSDFDDAVSDAANGTLYIDSTVIIDSDLTIPNTVSVVVLKQGLFSINTGVTLSIAGSFGAGDYQTFERAGTGTVRLGAGERINILNYVSGGAGTAVDPYSGWEWAITDLNASDISTEFLFKGGDVIETGVFKSTETLTLLEACSITGVGKSVNTSPRILGSHSGAAVVSLKGANYCTIKNMTISGDSANPPKTGLMLGRFASSASAGGHYFQQMAVRGYFSEAAVYSIACEEITFVSTDFQLLGGGGIHAFYTSQDDDLSVDSLGGSTNSRVTFSGFLISNEVDDVDASGIYIQGGAATVNHLYSGGGIFCFRGRYVQINSGGSTIGNLAGPVEFNLVQGESGNLVNPPTVAFDLTVPSSEGATDCNNLKIKQVNFAIPAGSNLVEGATGSDFLNLIRCEIQEQQGHNIQVHGAISCAFDITGNITFLDDVFGTEIKNVATASGKTVSISGSSGGNRIFDAKELGQLTPLKGFFGTSGATASGSASLTLETNVDQQIQLLTNTSSSQGLYCGDSRGAARGALIYNHSKDAWEIGAASYGIDFYLTAVSPEGQVSAAVGSLCLNTSGGSGTVLYVKESGTGNTGWAAK